MRTIGLLLRQRARRDAVSLAVWLAGLAALAAAGYPGVRSSYGDEQERVALLGTVMANPVVLLFRGLPSGAGEAQMVAFLLLPWLLLLVALMCSFLAVRHTRGDEEEGRLELVSATAAGRTAPLVATALHGVGASIVAGAVVAVIFVASGAPPVGAALIAAGCTLAGTVFLGVALVAGELMPSSRAANALAVWILVGTFALAGTGNALGTPNADLTRMTSSALTWFSPFGWAENTRPFDTDDAWPLAASVLATLVLLGGAALLHARRDLGASFVPPRTGRAAARPGFATHLALTVRQSRAAGIGWIVAGLLVGILSTSLAGVASRIGEGNPAVTSLLQALSGTSADLSRGLIVVFFVMLGIFAACAATQTVLRARQDETQGTAELVLGGGLTRTRWLADHVVVAAACAVLTIAAGIAGAAAGALSGGTDADLIRAAAVAGAGQIVPACLFAAWAAVLVVALPRTAIALAWALVAVAAVIALFGPLFGLSTAVVNASPFASGPVPTGEGVDPRGIVPLLVVAAVGVAAALGGMHRRELVA
ncbi:exporter of polyketide antibiotics [Microbacterium laevaniformans OR221]|nr:exporter of polyketide antibiotics [Microbacterium laevaniformans OR221]